MKCVLAAVCLVVMLARVSEGLSCFPCWEVECTAPLGCKFGTEPNVCGCCEVCKPGPGEKCGGPWQAYGSCGAGLRCAGDNSYSGPGTCIQDASNDLSRAKRGLANTRRAGLSKVQAKVHTHQASGGIPEHIKQQLRARGINI